MNHDGQPDVADPAAPRRRLPVALLVVAMGVVVALAAQNLNLLVRPVPLPGWRLWAVRAVGALAAAVGGAALLRQRRALLAVGLRNPDPTVVGIRTAATIMGVLTVLALFGPPLPPLARTGGGLGLLPLRMPAWGLGADHGGGDPPPSARGGDSSIRGDDRDVPVLNGPGNDPPPEGGPGRALAERAIRFLPFLLLMMMAMALFRRRGRLREIEVPEPDVPLGPARAEAGLQASLDELTGSEGDPRFQITVAYRTLLTALAEADAQRLPQEAPHEHLRRVLTPLGVRPDPLHRLAALYVEAQFGERPVGEHHRMAAAAALEKSLADLRAHRGAAAASRGRAARSAGVRP